MGLKRNFSVLLSAKVVTAGLALVGASLINRGLGPEQRGSLAEMLSWIAVFMTFCGLSLDTSLRHFSNRTEYPQPDADKFVTGLFLHGIFGAAGSIVLIIFAGLFPTLMSAESLRLTLVLALLLILMMLVRNASVFVESFGLFASLSKVNVTTSVLRLGLIAAGFFLIGMGAEYVVWLTIVVQATTFILLTVALIRRAGWSGHIDATLAVDIVRAGMKQHIGTVSMFVYTKANILILHHFCGATETGYLGMAVGLAGFCMMMPGVLQVVLYPRVLQHEDDVAITIRTARLLFYVWGGMVLAGILLARWMILVYGGEAYLPAVAALRWQFVVCWLLPVNAVFAPLFVKRGVFGIMSLSAVCLGCISVGLNYMLIQVYGATGAACASALTVVAGFAMVLAIYKCLMEGTLRVFFAPPVADVRILVNMLLFRKRSG